MLTITRYVNGIKVDDKDMKNMIVESDVITRTIQAVNNRLKISTNVNNSKK